MELVSAQVKLMRLELVGDARSLGTRLVRVVIFLPFAVLGYAFAAAAAAYALGTRLGFGWSFAIFGVVHGAVGTWGLVRAAGAFRQIRMLDRSREELERSLRTVAPALTGVPDTLTPPAPRRPPTLPASSEEPAAAASSDAPPAGARVRD